MKEYNKNKGIQSITTATPKKKSSSNNTSTNKRPLTTSPLSGLMATPKAADEDEGSEPKRKIARKSNPRDSKKNDDDSNAVDRDTTTTTTAAISSDQLEDATSLVESDVEADLATGILSEQQQQQDVGTDLVSFDIKATLSDGTSLVPSDVDTFTTTTTPLYSEMTTNTIDAVMSPGEELNIASTAILSDETTIVAAVDSLVTLDDDDDDIHGIDSFVQPSLEEDMEMSEAIGSLNEDW